MEGTDLVKKNTANAVLNEALRTGGDLSELFVQDSGTNTVPMVDGKVENAKYQRRAGWTRAFGY